MNVSFTPPIEELIRSEVASGLWAPASEVPREGLCLMDEQDRMRTARLDQLRDDIPTRYGRAASQPCRAEKAQRSGRARRARRPA